MRIATAALFALAASPAAAEPALDSGAACEVRFVRAPDDVRHVIETWLAAEPRCTSSIDLRVVPTGDGFYLLAQRPDGRLHERVVPDAQSAGVLVASWVADDWVKPQADAPISASPPAPEPALAPPRDMMPTSVSVLGHRRSPLPHTSRWLSAGALLSTRDSDDGGLRLEIDFASRGNFTLGAALAWTETSMVASTLAGYGEMRSSDIAVTGYAAYTRRAGRWELRGSVGLGGVYSELDGSVDAGPYGASAAMPFYGDGGGLVGTASLILGARITDNWGLHGGVLAHAISEKFASSGDEVAIARNDSHLFFFTGLRRRI